VKQRRLETLFIDNVVSRLFGYLQRPATAGVAEQVPHTAAAGADPKADLPWHGLVADTVQQFVQLYTVQPDSRLYGRLALP
jgi:hypothetical protein